ncbi:hypothetical protein OHS33_35515 [Streptomyces sp. NBC_00536]|uniref:hypothetical protein n=1 Tax=Streptomyces sp. NBC_00536 TaxID=2975769 RepID=UPI002E7FEDC6|nr:hypothetical protein [Streptomyces sp. NBC_00536]WUC83215.1 hypothetical protein OHS33_35515 [Streptomyces sp. NBC_00536]
MSSTRQAIGSEHPADPQDTGTGSLLLGIAALGAIGCPFLPERLPTWIRFVPCYFVLPLGICALVWGLPTVWRTRSRGTSSPVRARMGVSLGTVVIVAAVVPLAWYFWFADIG